MSEHDARSLASLALIAGGLVLYVLFDSFTPSGVVLGSLRLGDSNGECHGISRQGGSDVILAVCK